MPSRKLLEDRADWYGENCPGLDEGNDYASGGDLAEDASKDLYAALAHSQHNEQVVTEMLADADIYEQRAVRAGISTAAGRVQVHAAERLRSWAALLKPTSQTS